MKTLVETTLMCADWLILVNVAKEMKLLFNGP
jgi:hypothetical protein